MNYTVTSFGKAFAYVRNCLLKKTHFINKNIDGSYAKTTQRRIQQALCKNKKTCYTDLLHFSTRKHNLVSFFG